MAAPLALLLAGLAPAVAAAGAACPELAATVLLADLGGDGNAGEGLLDALAVPAFAGSGASLGPYCLPWGNHSLAYASDAAGARETTLSVVDAFGTELLAASALQLAAGALPFEAVAPATPAWCAGAPAAGLQAQAGDALSLAALSVQGDDPDGVWRLQVAAEGASPAAAAAADWTGTPAELTARLAAAELRSDGGAVRDTTVVLSLNGSALAEVPAAFTARCTDGAVAELEVAADGSGAMGDKLLGSGKSSYEPLQSCAWRLRGASRWYATAFDLAAGDYVAVYDGEDASAPLLGRFAGADRAQASGSSGSLFVQFVSDAVDEAAGFTAVYTGFGAADYAAGAEVRLAANSSDPVLSDRLAYDADSRVLSVAPEFAAGASDTWDRRRPVALLLAELEANSSLVIEAVDAPVALDADCAYGDLVAGECHCYAPFAGATCNSTSASVAVSEAPLWALVAPGPSLVRFSPAAASFVLEAADDDVPGAVALDFSPLSGRPIVGFSNGTVAEVGAGTIVEMDEVTSLRVADDHLFVAGRADAEPFPWLLRVDLRNTSSTEVVAQGPELAARDIAVGPDFFFLSPGGALFNGSAHQLAAPGGTSLDYDDDDGTLLVAAPSRRCLLRYTTGGVLLRAEQCDDAAPPALVRGAVAADAAGDVLPLGGGAARGAFAAPLALALRADAPFAPECSAQLAADEVQAGDAAAAAVVVDLRDAAGDDWSSLDWEPEVAVEGLPSAPLTAAGVFDGIVVSVDGEPLPGELSLTVTAGALSAADSRLDLGDDGDDVWVAGVAVDVQLDARDAWGNPVAGVGEAELELWLDGAPFGGVPEQAALGAVLEGFVDGEQVGGAAQTLVNVFPGDADPAQTSLLASALGDVVRVEPRDALGNRVFYSDETAAVPVAVAPAGAAYDYVYSAAAGAGEVRFEPGAVDSVTVAETTVAVPATTTRVELQEISGDMLAAVSTVAALAVAATGGFAYLIWRWREHSVIKLSQRRFSLLIVLGSAMALSAVFCLGGEPTDALCATRQVLPHLAMAVIYGSLFSKLWRVHVIMGNKQMRRIDFGDAKLLVVVARVLGAVAAYLVVWMAVDPPRRRLRNGGAELQPVAGATQLQYYACESDAAAWEYVLVGAEALALLAGSVLAFVTRVWGNALAESKHVGIAVFNVLLIGGTVMLIMLAAGDQLTPDARYAIQAIGIVCGTMSTLGIIFIPKFLRVALSRRRGGDESDTTGGGGGDQSAATDTPVGGGSSARPLSLGAGVNEYAVDMVELQRREIGRLNARIAELGGRVDAAKAEAEEARESLRLSVWSRPSSSSLDDGSGGVESEAVGVSVGVEMVEVSASASASGEVAGESAGESAKSAEEQEPEAEADEAEEQEPEAEADGAEEQEPEAEADGAEEQEPEAEADGAEEQEPEAEADRAEEQEPEAEADGAEEQEPEADGTEEQEPEAEAGGAEEQEPEAEADGAEAQDPEPEADGAAEEQQAVETHI